MWVETWQQNKVSKESARWWRRWIVVLADMLRWEETRSQAFTEVCGKSNVGPLKQSWNHAIWRSICVALLAPGRRQLSERFIVA
jgi:hypothetical protein